MPSSADLTGRRVLVAGASGGIGRAVTARLAADGARLVLVARSAAPLQAVADQVGATAIPVDVSDRAAVEALRADLESDGPLDAVIHAAGGFDLAPVAETDPRMFDAMIAANLTGPFLLMRAFLPRMIREGAGHLVTVGSVAGRVAFPGNGAYSASKFGVRGLHAVLDQELRGTGVRATLVEPAATDTAIWDPLHPDGRDDLPSRADMLSADAVGDAVHFAITRPRDVHIPFVAVQRS